MQIRKLAVVMALIVACICGSGASALAETLPGTSPGAPLASGQLDGLNAHGAIHCQTAAEIFADPTLAPGSAPGVVVITPQGPRLGAPRGGLCAEIYTVFTGQQP